MAHPWHTTSRVTGIRQQVLADISAARRGTDVFPAGQRGVAHVPLQRLTRASALISGAAVRAGVRNWRNNCSPPAVSGDPNPGGLESRDPNASGVLGSGSARSKSRALAPSVLLRRHSTEQPDVSPPLSPATVRPMHCLPAPGVASWAALAGPATRASAANIVAPMTAIRLIFVPLWR